MSTEYQYRRWWWHVVVAAAAGLLAAELAGCGQRIASAGDEAHPIAVVFAAPEDPALANGGDVADAGTLSSDIALLIRVKSALDSEPVLGAFQLDVGVMRGVVTLYGEVDTPERYARAVQIAQRIPGVQAVKSGIAVIRRA